MEGRGLLEEDADTAIHGNALQETPIGIEKDSEKKTICRPIGLRFARTIEKLTPWLIH
jgi:hypothetical protein